MHLVQVDRWMDQGIWKNPREAKEVTRSVWECESRGTLTKGVMFGPGSVDEIGVLLIHNVGRTWCGQRAVAFAGARWLRWLECWVNWGGGCGEGYRRQGEASKARPRCFDFILSAVGVAWADWCYPRSVWSSRGGRTEHAVPERSCQAATGRSDSGESYRGAQRHLGPEGLKHGGAPCSGSALRTEFPVV